LPDIAPAPAEPAPAPLPQIAALVAEVKRCQSELDAAKAALHAAVTGVNDQLAEATSLLWNKPPPARLASYLPRGQRLDQVRPCWESGMTIKAAAKQLAMRPDNVRRAYDILERQKKLQAPPSPSPLPSRSESPKAAADAVLAVPLPAPRISVWPLPPDPSPATSRYPAPPARAPAGPPVTRSQSPVLRKDSEGATVEEIHKEVRAQMVESGGHNPHARLLTTETGSHKHVAEVDGRGQGNTHVGKDGHFHVIRDFVVMPRSDGDHHRHELTDTPADGN
jgi:hypothetical protein